MKLCVGTLRQKRNQAIRRTEGWQPPHFSPCVTTWQKAFAFLRRCLDLPAASIWSDLRAELRDCHGTLLDVGCGAQPYRPLIPAGVHYVAIDTQDAKDCFGYESPETVYFPGDTWPIDDASVDTILCTETLEHVLDPELFLRQASRCLRPAGRLVLTVPFAARWHYVPYDYWRFTPSGLAHLLTGAGFDHVEVYARGNPLTVACYKSMALLLPLLLPQSQNWLARLVARLGGLLTAPLLLGLAVIGNLSLNLDWGEDCLGYTVVAERLAVAA